MLLLILLFLFLINSRGGRWAKTLKEIIAFSDDLILLLIYFIFRQSYHILFRGFNLLLLFLLYVCHFCLLFHIIFRILLIWSPFRKFIKHLSWILVLSFIIFTKSSLFSFRTLLFFIKINCCFFIIIITIIFLFANISSISENLTFLLTL